MLQFSIGLSALQAAQAGLSIAGNNLANASTPGYHKQSLQLNEQTAMQVGGLSLGRGVTVTDITRAVNNQLESSLTQQLTQNAMTDAQLTSSSQVQQALTSGIIPSSSGTSASLGAFAPETQLEALLSNLQQLSASPTDASLQQAAVASASSVANAFNTVSDSLTQIQRGLDQSIIGAVNQVNPLIQQIGSLNQQISQLTSQGINANDLLDQQGQLVNNLAQLMNIQVQKGQNGQISVVSSGVALVAGSQTISLAVGTDQSNNATINVAGTKNPLVITGGQLGGLLTQRNNQVPDLINRVNSLAQQVAQSFDAIQSTGLGTAGSFTQLNGQRGVNSVTANLNAAGLAFPPTAGSLFIGVTNTATGQRTMTEVPVDPKTESIQDVANSISSTVPNMHAFVNSQTGTLSMTAAPGYSFDFTGGMDSSPTTSFSGGTTTTPTAGGTYTGSTNDNYTFTFTSSGTVGVTPGLQAQLTDKTGAVIGTFNVGQGYSVGQPLTIANGITMSLSAGNVVQNDSFSSSVVGDPDSAGLLTGLGLNTLFSGNDAASLTVNSDLVNDPSRLASSRTGQPGDISNLQRFAGLADATTMSDGTQSFSQYSNSMVSDVASAVQTLTQQQSTNQLLTTGIQTQQQSVSGVDTNEELADVLKYQQMFELAGKYISAVNDALQQLYLTMH